LGYRSRGRGVEMPGLIRKLTIYAATSGLVIQSHGSVDHHQAIKLDYKSRRITDSSKLESENGKQETQLEAHGIIGE
jgi:hypothetical protein